MITMMQVNKRSIYHVTKKDFLDKTLHSMCSVKMQALALGNLLVYALN
jgi:hypothetical protein